MKSLLFLPPNSSANSVKDRKTIQSYINVHTAKHRREQEARRKQKAAAEYWKRRDQDDHEVHLKQLQRRCAKPDSILGKGNSDPFGAYAVPITPRLNQILSFYITNFLPTYYDIALVPSPSTQDILDYRYFESQIDYGGALQLLQEESSAHGFFLAYGGILADLSGSLALHTEILKLKSLAVGELQSQLQKHNTGDQRTLDAVQLLFTAAVYSGDQTEATVHGKVLGRLLYQKALHEGFDSIDIGFLFQSLWLDLALSATFLTHTILDVDVWVPNVFAVAFAQDQLVQSPILMARGTAFALDCAVKQPLRTIFVDLRRFLWMWWNYKSQISVANTAATLFNHLYAEFFIHSSRLINYLVVIRNGQLPTDAKATLPYMNETWTRWHTQNVLAIALLALVSASTTTILNAGKALVMATNLIMTRLKDALLPVLSTSLSLFIHERAPKLDPIDPQDELTRAALWALFIGTTIDHIPSSKQSGGRESSKWFTHNFVLMIRHMPLKGPQSVKTILRRFIYTDYMLPDETVWKRAFQQDAASP